MQDILENPGRILITSKLITLEGKPIKVLIISNILRPGNLPSEHSQFVYDLLGTQIGLATGLPVKIFPTELREEAYSRAMRPQDPASWAALSCDPEFGKALFHMWHAHFENSIVVGFETPLCLLEALDDAGVTYLNLLQHPLRFLDDVFFDIQTNSAEVRNALGRWVMNGNLPKMFAGLRCATIRKFAPTDVIDGATVIVGQTDVDTSLIRDGKLLHWESFQSELQQFCNTAPAIYIKPHPYGGQGGVDFLLNMLPGAVIRYENIYSWLCNERVNTVMGLTSSSLIEAKSFGKQSISLSPYPFNVDRPLEDNYFFPIYNGFLNTRFWSDLFAAMGYSVSGEDCEIPFMKSRLRTAFSNFYGYGALDTDITLFSAPIIQKLRSGLSKLEGKLLL